MLLPLRHDLIAVLFDLFPFCLVNHPIFSRFTDELRVTANPLDGLHQAIVNVGVIDLLDFHQRA